MRTWGAGVDVVRAAVVDHEPRGVAQHRVLDVVQDLPRPRAAERAVDGGQRGHVRRDLCPLVEDRGADEEHRLRGGWVLGIDLVEVGPELAEA